ncbi:virion phosphoprotein [Yokapox virus]|uniref:Assembly protein G7 n=1 Tax=Yokapox virus TaxID=1076255 RepID=G3EIE3_9POXV|nr:virion phosphoprotein [Yokapox virus]AEN03654.1 virion phosphoprotein [Yokapox virus]
MMSQERQSIIFDIVSKCLVRNVFKDLSINTDYIEDRAKQLCYCNPSKKESLINNIYSRCENELVIRDKEHLLSVLDNLRCNSVYVCNTVEFWRLFNSLKRLTHTLSFFNICRPTILATLSTLLTLIISNKLIYAAEMVEFIEGRLDSSNKTFSQELAELLELKYALVNLVQYRILPMILGEPIITAGFCGKDPISDYSEEADRLIELPVKTDIVDNVYKYLYKKGINTSNNVAEYIAGLKIEEVQTIANTLPSIISSSGLSTGNNEAVSTIASKGKGLLSNINENQIMEYSKLLDIGKQYIKGYKTDGAVSSPITNNGNIATFIPISGSDMQKFTILEYLYIMRVMANNIKKKNESGKSNGVVVHINSPLKIINLPK